MFEADKSCEEVDICFFNLTEAFFKRYSLLPALISGRYIKRQENICFLFLYSFLSYSLPRRGYTNIFRNSLQQIRRISVSVKNAMSGKVELSNDIQWSICNDKTRHGASEKFDGTFDTKHGWRQCYFKLLFQLCRSHITCV